MRQSETVAGSAQPRLCDRRRDKIKGRGIRSRNDVWMRVRHLNTRKFNKHQPKTESNLKGSEEHRRSSFIKPQSQEENNCLLL